MLLTLLTRIIDKLVKIEYNPVELFVHIFVKTEMLA